MSLQGGVGDADHRDIDVRIVVDDPLHFIYIPGGERGGGGDRVRDGVVVGDGQPVLRDEEAAGLAGDKAFVPVRLRLIGVQTEHGGRAAVRHLPGGEGGGQQAQGVGRGPGDGPLAHQASDHCGAAVPVGEGQSVRRHLKQVPLGQGAGIGDGEEADPLGETRGVGNGKVARLVGIPQHPQQEGAPGVGGEGRVRPEGCRRDAGDPALPGGVVHLLGDGGGNIPEAGQPVVCRGGLFCPGQMHQQHGRLCPGGGGVQIICRVDQSQGGEGVRGPGRLPLQSGGGGDHAHRQDKDTEERKKSFFHGVASKS